MKKFKFSEIQAQAILDMKLQKLAGLERKKIEDELKEILKYIKDLKALLKSVPKMLAVIKEELLEIKEKKVPEMTDELAKEFGFESVEDFDKKNRERLQNQKKREVQAKLQEQILEKLIEENNFDVVSFSNTVVARITKLSSNGGPGGGSFVFTFINRYQLRFVSSTNCLVTAPCDFFHQSIPHRFNFFPL